MKLFGTILVVWFLCNFRIAVGDVINVPGDLPTIQLAVDSANDGDSIVVSPGIYYENVWILLKNNVSLVGSGSDVTTIHGDSIGATVGFSSSSGLLTGFTITSVTTTPNSQTGISVSGGSINIEYNIITENYNGIAIGSNAEFSIQYNKVIDNHGYKGVHISGASTGIIHNNLIANNGQYYALDCTFSSPTIINNTIIGGGSFGIFLQPNDTQLVYNNIITDCEYGIIGQFDSLNPTAIVKIASNNLWNNLNNYIVDWGAQPFAPTPGTGEIYTDPKFNNPSNADFTLSSSSPAINAGTKDTNLLNLQLLDLANNPRISGSDIDIGAYEFQEILSLANEDERAYLAVHPNPMTESTQFIIEANENEDFILELYNTSGKLLNSKYAINSNIIIFQRDGLPSGMYYYRLKKDTELFRVGKLIML